MKPLTSSLLCMLAATYQVSMYSATGQGLRLPGDSIIQDHLNTPNPPEITPEELAIPPLGEIQKIHLRNVNQTRGRMAEKLSTVPAGEEGLGSPWYIKVQAYKAGLDTVAASRLQADCIAMVPVMREILISSRSPEDRPENSDLYGGYVNDLSTVLVNAIERHIIDQNATVSAGNLTKFITFFTLPGFRSEGDWEDSPIPVNAPGIMILDAASVVAQLKAQPWQNAAFFIGNRDATEAFERYEPGGNGMDVLKAKYAANTAAIIAKWQELETWVVQQSTAP